MNINKNQVSYFIAGYKAALVANKLATPEKIEELDYKTIEFGNNIKAMLREYDKGKYDQDGLEEMYNFLTKQNGN